jgi:hypothetical protein
VDDLSWGSRLDADHPENGVLIPRLITRTGNLRACQLLLGHTKLESTVRYLGIEADDALVMSEQTDI